MIFNKHSSLKGMHAFLSASKYHWVNYDAEKLDNAYQTQMAAQRGSELHDLAAGLIKHGVKMARTKQTMNMYINDAIGFKMKPEQTLFYSVNAFGTADAISFRENLLRIHDLKTGTSPTSVKQLIVYSAFFCLEYGYRPHEIQIELRIYQNDEVMVYAPTDDEVVYVMDKIIEFDNRIEDLKEHLAA